MAHKLHIFGNGASIRVARTGRELDPWFPKETREVWSLLLAKGDGKMTFIDTLRTGCSMSWAPEEALTSALGFLSDFLDSTPGGGEDVQFMFPTWVRDAFDYYEVEAEYYELATLAGVL